MGEKARQSRPLWRASHPQSMEIGNGRSGQPGPWIRFPGRFVQARSGAAAIEFGLIAIPFLMLLMGVFELGMLFVASTTLDSATASASRLIRTGQLQASGNNTAAGFQSTVCANMAWLSSTQCASQVLVDVRTFSDFASVSASPPVSNGALDPTQTEFDPGGACSIVLVRVFFPYTLIAPLLQPGIPNLGSSQVLITSSAAFRNEDYGSATPCS